MTTRIALVTAALGLTSAFAATTVATVGDSFADAFYMGMWSQPNLLKEHDIQLVRWSRPIIGLTRADFFDYPSWLRDNTTLGAVDVCVVQIGTNDAQSMKAGGKWVKFATDRWNSVYAERVRAVDETLRARRCKETIWVLQPRYELNRYLREHRDAINKVQTSVLDPARTLVLETSANAADYGKDRIHYNGKFDLKLGQAMFRLIVQWRQAAPESCFACHSKVDVNQRLAVDSLGPLRVFKRR
jgi:hypothetical protein